MRRVFTDPDFRAGFAEMLPACIAVTPFSMVCGLGAAAAGASVWAAIGLSAIVFSGVAQVLAVQLLAAGAPLLVIIVTCFVTGLRLFMYSAAMAPHLRPLPPRAQHAIAFLLTDQAFAASIRRFDAGAHPREGMMHFLGGGVALWSVWQVNNLIGYFAGSLIPTSWSLEFAVPLCFIALVAPTLRSIPVLSAAFVAGILVVMLDGLPMRLNLIVAGLIGIAAGTIVDVLRERWTRR
jgi:predicted branched-subunit amino acid permease